MIYFKEATSISEIKDIHDIYQGIIQFKLSFKKDSSNIFDILDEMGLNPFEFVFTKKDIQKTSFVWKGDDPKFSQDECVEFNDAYDFHISSQDIYNINLSLNENKLIWYRFNSENYKFGYPTMIKCNEDGS